MKVLWKLVIVAAVLGAVGFGSCRQATALGAQHAQATVSATPTATKGPVDMVNDRVDRLDRDVDHLQDTWTFLLIPMSILVAFLAIGGGLGVVFSIRDQRRVGQLHELAVGAEMASQRRTEQSFTAFLEGSQTTLTLVNDTLQLAKQATESERDALKRRASAGLKEVEEKAEDLVLRVAKTEDFDVLLDIRDHRTELERIAAELSRLDTYRQLQEDIELPPYSRFILGIQQFLNDDTRTALRTLRVSTEEPKPQLQRMALYWSSKFNTALGEYDEARWLLSRAVTESAETRIARLEYRRLLREVEFYEFADAHADATPSERYEGLKDVIADLAELAPTLAEKTKNDDRQHPNFEMRETRADIFMWIAYDPDNLARPLAHRLELSAEKLRELHDANPSELLDDELRAWAVWQAEDLYPAADELGEEGADVTFALRLGRVESDFALGFADPDSYPPLERHAVDDQRREHREHRHTIELAQIALLCEARLLYLETPGDYDGRQTDRGLHEAMGDLTGAVVTAPDHQMTVFSHLQRRNIRMDELEKEAAALEEQTLAVWEEAKKARAEAKAQSGDGPVTA